MQICVVKSTKSDLINVVIIPTRLSGQCDRRLGLMSIAVIVSFIYSDAIIKRRRLSYGKYLIFLNNFYTIKYIFFNHSNDIFFIYNFGQKFLEQQ